MNVSIHIDTSVSSRWQIEPLVYIHITNKRSAKSPEQDFTHSLSPLHRGYTTATEQKMNYLPSARPTAGSIYVCSRAPALAHLPSTSRVTVRAGRAAVKQPRRTPSNRPIQTTSVTGSYCTILVRLVDCSISWDLVSVLLTVSTYKRCCFHS